MKQTLLLVALLMLLGSTASSAQAGVIRHVVRPVVKHGASITAKVVKTTVHVAKRVVY